MRKEKFTNKGKIFTFAVFLFVAVGIMGFLGFLLVVSIFIFAMWLDKRKIKKQSVVT